MEDRPLKSGPTGPKIITAGLFRMGTASLAQAYATLGYTPHHQIINRTLLHSSWPLLERAVAAVFPHLSPSSGHTPLTAADWDLFFVNGTYDATGDLLLPFAAQLIQTFPDAKVVVVQRDFDSWWASFRNTIIPVLPSTGNGVRVRFVSFVASQLLGNRSMQTSEGMMMGLFGRWDSNSGKMVIDEKSAREGYERYYAEVRRLVPEGRRLEYRVGRDGWGPLCAFLGHEVPAQPFPRVNGRDEFQRMAGETINLAMWRLGGLLLAFFVGGGTLLYVYVTLSQRADL